MDPQTKEGRRLKANLAQTRCATLLAHRVQRTQPAGAAGCVDPVRCQRQVLVSLGEKQSARGRARQHARAGAVGALGCRRSRRPPRSRAPLSPHRSARPAAALRSRPAPARHQRHAPASEHRPRVGDRPGEAVAARRLERGRCQAGRRLPLPRPRRSRHPRWTCSCSGPARRQHGAPPARREARWRAGWRARWRARWRNRGGGASLAPLRGGAHLAGPGLTACLVRSRAARTGARLHSP